jgi:hypothetical protein
LVLNDVEGNSLVFDYGDNGGSSIDFGIDVQTQVEDNSEVEWLSSSVLFSALFVISLHLIANLTIDTNLSSLWEMVHSMQLLASLSILTVNMPG